MILISREQYILLIYGCLIRRDCSLFLLYEIRGKGFITLMTVTYKNVPVYVILSL